MRSTAYARFEKLLCQVSGYVLVPLNNIQNGHTRLPHVVEPNVVAISIVCNTQHLQELEQLLLATTLTNTKMGQVYQTAVNCMCDARSAALR